jgi:alanine-glyoxylate transaminase/serine-glyoxylate transaminase/serine-pyruvate transaminase
LLFLSNPEIKYTRPTMSIQSFHPPARTLMGPGPSDVNPRILEALSRPTIGHLDPVFVGMMEEMKELLRYAFQTRNPLTMPVSAPGSTGMETCFVNLVEPGDKVVVCQNGVFGGRMKENVVRAGGTAVMVEDEWGRAVDVNKVEEALKANPDAKILAFVHAETSTGAISDAKTLAELAREHDCLTIVDTVTSLAGSPLMVDDWELDAVYSGTQKCLSCVPGLSPVTFNQMALDVVTSALKAGFEAMGLKFVVPEDERLPQLNAVSIPAGVDEAAVRSALLGEYNLEIGAGLGAMAGKIWRVGLMGYASNRTNVLFCLGALDAVLSGMKAPIESGVAVDAARAVYAG